MDIRQQIKHYDENSITPLIDKFEEILDSQLPNSILEYIDDYIIPLMIYCIRYHTTNIKLFDSYPKTKHILDNLDKYDYANKAKFTEIYDSYLLFKTLSDIVFTTYSLSFNYKDEEYGYDYSSTYYFGLDNDHYPSDYDVDQFDSFSKDPISDIVKCCSNPPYGKANGIKKEYDLLYIYIQTHNFDDWRDTIGEEPDQIYELVDHYWKPLEIYKGEVIEFQNIVVSKSV